MKRAIPLHPPLTDSHRVTIEPWWPPVGINRTGNTCWSDPFILTLPRLVDMSMRGDSKMKQSSTAPSSAAEDSLTATRSLLASPVAAGARGVTLRAHDDSELWVSYSGELDVSDSGKAPEALKNLRCLFL